MFECMQAVWFFYEKVLGYSANLIHNEYYLTKKVLILDMRYKKDLKTVLLLEGLYIWFFRPHPFSGQRCNLLFSAAVMEAAVPDG